MYQFILVHKKAYYTLLIILLTALMVPLVFSNNIWGDEAFTMLTIQQDIPAMWDELVADVHPFLYYWIVKCFVILFGESIVVVKFVSILPVVFTMVLGATVIDKYFGKGGISVSSFFICAQVAAPFFLTYAIELRMYSWALFFVTASALLAYRIAVFGITKKHTALLIATGICAAATHYFALLAIAIIYGTLFLVLVIKERCNVLYCVIVSAITIVVYLPGLYVFILQFMEVSESYWILPMTLFDIVVAVSGPMVISWLALGGYCIDALFALAALAAGLSLLHKICAKDTLANKQEDIVALLFMALFFVWLVVTIVISFTVCPLYVRRYGFPTYALFWLGVIIGIRNISVERLRIAAFWVLATAMLCSGVYAYCDEISEAYDDGASTLLAYINEEQEEEIYELSSDTLHLYKWMLSYYFPEETIKSYDAIDFTTLPEGEVIYYLSGRDTLELIEVQMQEYDIGYEYIYSGNIDRYDWNLFKLYHNE